MGIGGLAAAAALVTVLSPRAHAVAAALVQVVNTTSNPVPVFNTGIQEYQSTRTIPPAPGPIETCFQTECGAAGQFDAAPTGSRLVIENVSGIINALPSPPSGPPVVLLQALAAINQYWGVPGTLGPVFQGSGASNITPAVFNQKVKAYFGAGIVPLVVVFSDTNRSDALFTLSGYLENCAITGCP
jgi:hypothetical protein